jgi:hypothetical protein
MEFMIVESHDQIETQGKFRIAIAIPLTEDPKHFQLTKVMLNHDPLASQRMVSLLLLLGQRMIFRFLERVVGSFYESLLGSECVVGKLIVLEQRKVMLAARTKGVFTISAVFWVGISCVF